MKIAIQAADLDHNRIDGTRVYILNMLRHFGKISTNDDFFIYHRRDFNPELTPPNLSNYKIKKINFPFFWTQTRFACGVLKDNPDILWMPMHNLPVVRRGKLKTVVTVHDLAYKYFPEYFPKKDLRELNLLGDYAIRNAKKLIAVSESTKKDILKFYPKVKDENIKVIHHGFDAGIYSSVRDETKENKVKKSLGINGGYILYSGAIQPRKNLEVLIEAFELYKKKSNSDIKLVLAGGNAWLWEDVVKKARNSRFRRDIIMPGKLKFSDLGHLMRGADVYTFPSLYEGFGITILEALASGVPVISASNSSLPEVGGDAVEYFQDNNQEVLAKKIESVLLDKDLKSEMVAKGIEQIQKFSWEKCAQETLRWIKD
ncbi:glycosyltransferase family 4 protein [Patescibacteria group bacterium]